MSQKTTTKDDEKPVDIMPDVPDDPVEGAGDEQGQDTVAAKADDGEAEEPAKPYDYRAEVRDAAVEAYRRKRAEDEEVARAMHGMPPNAPKQAEEAEQEAVDEPVAEVVEEPAKAAPQQAAPISDDTEVELVVYGVPVKKKLGELKADAQKLLAADQKLDEAKRTAEEARQLLKSAQSRRGQDPDEADQPTDDGELDTRPARKTTKADQPDIDLPDADIDSIVERIQIGDKEEGRSAVSDLVKLLAKGNTSRLDERKVTDIATDAIVRTEITREINTALESFNAKFPQIVKDDELVDVALRRVSKELQADLKAAGMSDDDLSKITTPGELAKYHGEIRRKGATKLRSYDAVLTAVGTHLQTKFGAALTPTSEVDTPKKPAPTPASPPASKVQQRVDMKRAAPQQPKAAGARSPTQATGPRPKTHSEIVMEIRKARGFQN